MANGIGMQLTSTITLLVTFLLLLGCPAPPKPVVNITPTIPQITAENASAAIAQAKLAIDVAAAANKNTTAAERQLGIAVAFFTAGNYTAAFEAAQLAQKLAIEAKEILPEKPKMCEELSSPEMERCIIQRAFTTRNFSDCKLLSEVWFDMCVVNFAQYDFGYCLEFVALNATDKSDDCLINVSVKHGEIACGLIMNSTKIEQCKIQFVSEVCKSIKNESERYICDAIEKKNSSICDRRETNKDLCLLKFSQKVRNVCHQIATEYIRRACSAILYGNFVYCVANITAIADACYRVIAVETKNCSVCANVKLTDYIDSCYFDCARVANDPTACAGAVTELVRDNCWHDLGISLLNASLCDKIILKGLRIDCVFKVARGATEPAICEKLEERIKDCYTQAMLQPTITQAACARMALSYDRDLCFMEVVRHTQNKTVCDFISDSALRDWCKK